MKGRHIGSLNIVEQRQIAERVTHSQLAIGLAKTLIGFGAAYRWLRGEAVTFAHNLQFPDTEVFWPGEATDLFFPELFAVAPYGGEPFVLSTSVHYHLRNEILRMVSVGRLSALEEMEQELRLFIAMEANCASLTDYGSFPDFGYSTSNEPDTLNSELLLTQVYVPPQDVPLSWGKPPTTDYLDISSTLPGACYPTAGSDPTEKED